MLFAWVARHPLTFLIGTLVCAVVLGVTGQSLHDVSWLPVFALVTGLTFALIGLSMVGTLRYHPAVLTARPAEQAFATARNPALLFMAAAFTFLGASLVSENINDIAEAEDLWVLDAVTSTLWVLLVVLQWYSALGARGVRLRPDGIHDQQPLGSLFIPWEALAVPFGATPKSAVQLYLNYQQPRLIRKRGFRPGAQVLTSGTDSGYLAWVIHEYLTSPERRPAIGTDAELHRLSAGYETSSPR